MKVSFRALGTTFFAILLSAVAVRPAAAQSAPADVEVGYQYLHASASGTDTSFPGGLDVAVAGTIRGPWAALGEVSWSRHNDTVAGVSVHADATTYGGGIRWIPAGMQAVKPFAQFVIGAERDSASGVSSENSFMVQPGVGVIVPAGAVGLFANVDYRHVYSTVAQNDVRVAVGVRIPFGK